MGLRTVVRPVAPALLRSCHPGPTVAVTVLATLLALGAELGPGRVLLLAAAVLSGQLVIGWTNDLLDAGRDRAVGRRDKPVAAGEVAPGAVLAAALLAGVACVGLSAGLGWRSALCHLVLLVGSGVAYDLGVKGTVWSWLPYAVAFGSLPAVVTLAERPPGLPEWWHVLAGAALGVGAHLVNALPDLADDEATGVRGLPHRLGARGSRAAAAAVLLTASVAVLLGRPPRPAALVAVLVLLVALAAVLALGWGRAPFRAAVALALLDVVLLVVDP